MKNSTEQQLLRKSLLEKLEAAAEEILPDGQTTNLGFTRTAQKNDSISFSFGYPTQSFAFDSDGELKENLSKIELEEALKEIHTFVESTKSKLSEEFISAYANPNHISRVSEKNRNLTSVIPNNIKALQTAIEINNKYQNNAKELDYLRSVLADRRNKRLLEASLLEKLEAAAEEILPNGQTTNLGFTRTAQENGAISFVFGDPEQRFDFDNNKHLPNSTSPAGLQESLKALDTFVANTRSSAITEYESAKKILNTTLSVLRRRENISDLPKDRNIKDIVTDTENLNARIQDLSELKKQRQSNVMRKALHEEDENLHVTSVANSKIATKARLYASLDKLLDIKILSKGSEYLTKADNLLLLVHAKELCSNTTNPDHESIRKLNTNNLTTMHNTVANDGLLRIAHDLIKYHYSIGSESLNKLTQELESQRHMGITRKYSSLSSSSTTPNRGDGNSVTPTLTSVTNQDISKEPNHLRSVLTYGNDKRLLEASLLEKLEAAAEEILPKGQTTNLGFTRTAQEDGAISFVFGDPRQNFEFDAKKNLKGDKTREESLKALQDIEKFVTDLKKSQTVEFSEAAESLDDTFSLSRSKDRSILPIEYTITNEVAKVTDLKDGRFQYSDKVKDIQYATLVTRDKSDELDNELENRARKRKVGGLKAISLSAASHKMSEDAVNNHRLRVLDKVLELKMYHHEKPENYSDLTIGDKFTLLSHAKSFCVDKRIKDLSTQSIEELSNGTDDSLISIAIDSTKQYYAPDSDKLNELKREIESSIKKLSRYTAANNTLGDKDKPEGSPLLEKLEAAAEEILPKGQTTNLGFTRTAHEDGAISFVFGDPEQRFDFDNNRHLPESTSPEGLLQASQDVENFVTDLKKSLTENITDASEEIQSFYKAFGHRNGTLAVNYELLNDIAKVTDTQEGKFRDSTRVLDLEAASNILEQQYKKMSDELERRLSTSRSVAGSKTAKGATATTQNTFNKQMIGRRLRTLNKVLNHSAETTTFSQDDASLLIYHAKSLGITGSELSDEIIKTSIKDSSTDLMSNPILNSAIQSLKIYYVEGSSARTSFEAELQTFKSNSSFSKDPGRGFKGSNLKTVASMMNKLGTTNLFRALDKVLELGIFPPESSTYNNLTSPDLAALLTHAKKICNENAKTKSADESIIQKLDDNHIREIANNKENRLHDLAIGIIKNHYSDLSILEGLKKEIKTAANRIVVEMPAPTRIEKPTITPAPSGSPLQTLDQKASPNSILR